MQEHMVLSSFSVPLLTTPGIKVISHLPAELFITRLNRAGLSRSPWWPWSSQTGDHLCLPAHPLAKHLPMQRPPLFPGTQISLRALGEPYWTSKVTSKSFEIRETNICLLYLGSTGFCQQASIWELIAPKTKQRVLEALEGLTWCTLEWILSHISIMCKTQITEWFGMESHLR